MSEQIQGVARCVSGLRQLPIPYQFTSDLGDEIFVHARRAPGGHERLVVVAFNPPGFVAGNRTPFTARAIARGGWLRPLSTNFKAEASQLPLEFVTSKDQPLKLYAGQPDPTDEAHFTIDYETPAGHGTIDGWLHRDDTVTLTARDGPAAAR
jgi:hypothetical protein